MATFHFDLVSPEKLAFSGEVDQVDVPGIEGDFGVLAGHAPVVAVISPGILTVTVRRHAAEDHRARRSCRSSDKGLTVLADVATSIEELDRAKFADTISGMEAKLTEKEGSELDRAVERLDTSRASSTSSTPRRCIRPPRPGLSAPSARSRKMPRDPAVHLAPERHHEIGDAIEPLPAPLVEFRRLAVARRQRIDLVVRPVKRSANHFCAGRGISRAGVTAARRRAGIRKSASRSRRGSRRRRRRSLPRFAHDRVARISSASMPPCGICHSRPGRMISGPSSLKRRPISTRPEPLNSAMPTLGR